MNLSLTNKRAYISGPIEHSDVGYNWRTEPCKILKERFKLDVFDPFSDPKQQWVKPLEEAREREDYETMRKIARGFVRKDLSLVDRSDLTIACLPYKIPTSGSHHEIINSINSKKPCLLICPQHKKLIPLWYFGFVPHEMMFGSWDALYDYLDEVNMGKHKHNYRWAFIYGLV
jgi:hypothetical protein